MPDKNLVFMVAGEPSGDLLGGRLIEALKAESSDELRLAGIGGPAMESQGLHSIFPMQELSLMGLMEIAPHIPRLLRRLNETAEAVMRLNPSIVVTIDSPGFTFRLAKRIRHLRVPIVHYVAPQIWAWRPQRAFKIAQFVDHIMALLPFEPEFFDRYGIDCTYVGHPAIEQGYNRGDGDAFRRRKNVPADAIILALLPGSRRGEIDRLLPVYRDALALLSDRTKDLAAVVPTTGAMHQHVAEMVCSWKMRTILVPGSAEQPDAYAACDAAITKSGTSTLHLALARVPMVVCYRVNPVTAFFGRRLINVSHVALANLLTDNPVVPELLQERCTAENVAREIGGLLNDPRVRMQQLASFKQVAEKLD
ncbi:MAG TPA: lipid-A-disaccharide synthase, partial [Afifellaceae bacterium]|nr:lipid-A-disaccharide synthase [Afifellaceae bacterium]